MEEVVANEEKKRSEVGPCVIAFILGCSVIALLHVMKVSKNENAKADVPVSTRSDLTVNPNPSP